MRLALAFYYICTILNCRLLAYHDTARMLGGERNFVGVVETKVEKLVGEDCQPRGLTPPFHISARSGSNGVGDIANRGLGSPHLPERMLPDFRPGEVYSSYGEADRFIDATTYESPPPCEARPACRHHRPATIQESLTARP